MQAQPKSLQIHFWRDKQGHEIDFVLQTGKKQLLVIECKSQKRSFSPKNLLAFRAHYPEGKNTVVTIDDTESAEEITGNRIHFMGIQQFFNFFRKSRV
jgi:predicted AAA+ superfamily ATPase